MSYPVTVQPQVTQGHALGSSQWSSDVMDCCDDMEICLCGTFVPCILACNVASDFGECCCLPYLPGTLIAMRTAMRERWGIPGSICDDWVCLVCYGECVLCQMARELKARR